MQGYPTIKMFPAGKKDAGDAVEYDGGRTSDAIVAWALDKLAENVPSPDVIEVSVPAVPPWPCITSKRNVEICGTCRMKLVTMINAY